MQLSGLGTVNPRQRNVGFLKQYPGFCKLTHMYSVRLPGYEERNRSPTKRGYAGNSEKLQNSLSRSKGNVKELALCNPWEYFVTFTLAPDKHDRNDLRGSYKKLAKWVNNYNSRNGTNIQYLLIPEPHRDGAWHFHGLLLGLPESHLTKFTLDDYIPARIKKMLSTGREVFNWPAYANSFGFVTVEPIRNLEHCALYITKYITKELQKSGIELNHHLYYCSHGLKRAELRYKGEIKRAIEAPDFKNDYMRSKRFPATEDALPYFFDEEEVTEWNR